MKRSRFTGLTNVDTASYFLVVPDIGSLPSIPTTPSTIPRSGMRYTAGLTI